MIRYSLVCSKGHGFEDWFSSSNAYDEDKAEGRLCCPECGDAEVTKAIMAPSLGRNAKTIPSCPSAQPACAAGGCAHAH
ncbi:MAG: DUF1178 family protein [Rhodospirillales bacterium]